MRVEDSGRSRLSARIAKRERADERTRTAYPCSLQVILHALQDFARACKSRIPKRFTFLRFASCCAVSRSRWCQSGVKHPSRGTSKGALALREARCRFICHRQMIEDVGSCTGEYDRDSHAWMSPDGRGEPVGNLGSRSCTISGGRQRRANRSIIGGRGLVFTGLESPTHLIIVLAIVLLLFGYQAHPRARQGPRGRVARVQEGGAG